MTAMRTMSLVRNTGYSPLSGRWNVGKLRQSEDGKVYGARRSLSADRGSELCRPRPRIGIDLGLAGRQCAAEFLEGWRPHLRLRQMAGNRRIAGAVSDEALDDAILERMEGHHRE